MATQTIFWTALPNGFDGESLRVSLLVSPRLVPNENPGQLNSFPDFVDWPATLSESHFILHFGAGSLPPIAGNDFVGPMCIDDRLGRPDSRVWKAMFPETTLVIGYEWRDLTKHSVLSHPAADLDQLIRDLYTDLAASADDQLPTAASFLAKPLWAKLLDAVAHIDHRFTDETGLRRIGEQFRAFKDRGFIDSMEATAANLTRFQLFHTPPSTPKTAKHEGKVKPDAQAYAQWQEFERTELPQRDDFQKLIDFHKMVSAMNQYPTLLRKLGLVVDLLIPRDAFAPASDALLWAEVKLPEEPDESPERVPAASPQTHTMLDRNRFQAVPRASTADLRVKDGLLDLDKNVFELLQADVDGSVMKAMNFARSLLILRNKPVQQEDPVSGHKREIGAPALRNAGLMLVQRRRADMLAKAVKNQAEFNKNATAKPPVSPEMVAEDLVRGYRIDIWDDVSQRWHSLCERQATYNIGDGAAEIDVPKEEGTVRLAATTSPDDKSNQDIIWLHEAVLSWAGWSLCVPPPGKTIGHQATKLDEDGKKVIVHEDPVSEPEAEVPPGLRLQHTFKSLKGRLPRLRYGRGYCLRARVVDLAGNSLEPPEDSGPENPPDKPTPYLRYEPISAPAIALVKPNGGATHEPAEGESMERMAIRSFNDTPPMNTQPATQRAYRFAVPPRTTHREAEQHGMLDRAGIVDPSFFATLAAKDDSLAEEKIKTAGPIDGREVETGYAVMVEGEELPYLPDPLAVDIAARLFHHPNHSSDLSEIIPIDFYDVNEWPHALPFKIEIYENPGDVPHYDEGSRTLLIPLPKAARVTLRLSVQPTPEALNVLGVWNWLNTAQQNRIVVINGRPSSLKEMASHGQHWMLTPWRNIELVHAVQRPLITPEFKSLEIFRIPGRTFAMPRFDATCSIASTDRIDLRAEWHEPVDDVEKNLLDDVPRIDNAFSVKITDDKSYSKPHEYELPAREVIRVNGESTIPIRGRELLRPPKVHEFHDTRYRRIKYWLEGTTKFREFLSASFLTESVTTETGDTKIEPTEKHIKVTGPEKVEWIKSSSLPPAPEVLYVVPTFGWVRSQDETGRKSWRRGGGLRVYLNRPWNVTGYGEMLAVVMPPENLTGDPNNEPETKSGEPAKPKYKKLVTQWGNDPIWKTAFFVSGASPRPSNFPLARFAADPDGKWLPSFAPAEEADQPPGPFKSTGLVPAEDPNGLLSLDIAPHDVFYDEERKLCYCDIEVTWGASYFPFIRLALARYQPVSVERAHLSNVVLADFMPLVPDRWLNVMRTNDPRIRRVRVFGNTYENSSGNVEAEKHRGSTRVAASSVVEVWVERFDPAQGEDFGWSRETRARIQNDRDVPPPPPLTVTRSRAQNLLRHREYAALLDENLIDRVFIMPTLWQGHVTLPTATDRGTRYRLVIAEYEEYLIDDDKPYDPPMREKGRRLVFVEHVPLD